MWTMELGSEQSKDLHSRYISDEVRCDQRQELYQFPQDEEKRREFGFSSQEYSRSRLGLTSQCLEK